MMIEFLAFRDSLIKARKFLKAHGYYTHLPVCDMFPNGKFYCRECYYQKYKEIIDNEDIFVP